MNNEEKKRNFILGLERLTRETGVIIGGCGCCDSPSLSIADLENLDRMAGYGSSGHGEVSWITPKNKDDWKNYRHNIVRKVKGRAYET